MRKEYLIILLLPIIISCSSTKDAAHDSKKETELQEGETYSQKGLALLAQPHEDRFFTFLNTVAPDSPGNKDTLLENYAKNQEELVSYFFEKGDIFKTTHYYKNLYAIKELPAEEIEAFYHKIDEKAGERHYNSYRKYLKILRGWELKGNDFSPLLPITEYNFVLTEIKVKREYVNEDGILRTDQPYYFGSGIAIDSHHILTTFHLIEDLFLNSTRSYELIVKQETSIYSTVKVLAWDSLLDLAVLETEEELQYIPDFYTHLGDSRTIQRGQIIYSLGHHGGYTSTLTKGIISAQDRKAPEGGTLIQVDASVAPGAGGGLLIGEDGLVYGMILGGIRHENLNFALPSNLILSVLDELIAGIEIKRPWLGAVITTKKELPGKVYLKGLFPSSPLAETGIKIDDEIVALNNVTIGSAQEAREILNRLEAGNLIQVRYKNATGEIINHVYLKRRPDYPVYSAIKNMGLIESLYLHFGFSVEPGFKKTLRQTIKNEKIGIDFYKVNTIEKDSHLEKMGVVIGDYVGILSDFYIQRTHYLEIIHLPADPKSHQPEYTEDYIYQLKKEEYDENVL